MNVDNGVDKAYEGCSFQEICEAPPSALQGLAERVDEPFKQVGISDISELGAWIIFKRAKAIVTLSSKESEPSRGPRSGMHLEGVVKKKDSRKLLSEIADSPLTILQGVTAKVAQVLQDTLGVGTVRELAENKYLAWAESFAVLADVKSAKEPSTPNAAAIAEPSTPTPSARKSLTPNQVMSLQLEEYKVTLSGLNERLKFYIDEIRARDETITELNAQLFQLKTTQTVEIQRLDASYQSQLQEIQTKVDLVHRQETYQLEQQLTALKAELKKEKEKVAASKEQLKQANKDRDQYMRDLGVAQKEIEDLKAQLAESQKRVGELESSLAALAREKGELEKKVVFVDGQLALSRQQVEHAAEAQKVAVEEVHKQHREEHRKQREDLLLQMHKELEALKKKLMSEYAAEKQVLVGKHQALKEGLEQELRRTAAQLADIETKAESWSRELVETRKLYVELKDRYERECGMQKVRISELTSDITNVNSSRTEMQAEFSKLLGDSATIVKEIDRYSVLLSTEESRLGIASPAPATQGKGKRRRTEEKSEEQAQIAFTTPLPAAKETDEEPTSEGGILGSWLKKRPFGL